MVPRDPPQPYSTALPSWVYMRRAPSFQSVLMARLVHFPKLPFCATAHIPSWGDPGIMSLQCP